MYENLGIYELREIGREIGVKCPTKLKREDLINSITNIKLGIDKPYIRKGQGRPVKHINLLNLKNKELSIEKFKEISKMYILLFEELKQINNNMCKIIDRLIDKIKNID